MLFLSRAIGIVRFPNTLGLPWNPVPRPTRVDPPHQFFCKLNGFIEGCFSRRRRLPVRRQSATQEYRADYTKSSLPALIHFRKISHSLYLRLPCFDSPTGALLNPRNSCPNRSKGNGQFPCDLAELAFAFSSPPGILPTRRAEDTAQKGPLSQPCWVICR
jgi:hypothetical protein